MNVTNVSASDLSDEQDLFVFSLGYEPRCTHVAESTSSVPAAAKVAIGYDHGHTESYLDAMDRFGKMGVKVVDRVSDEKFLSVMQDVAGSSSPYRRITVDISSLNRFRIATVIDVMQQLEPGTEVRYLYSPSKYSPPPSELTQNESFGPVNARFSGDLANPERPPGVVLGLGYETGKALGAVEFLQCSEIWIFVPRSQEEPRFEQSVLQANDLLVEHVGKERVLNYFVADPAGTYADLCSLLEGVSRLTNPVLLPLGPKIFATVCLLAGTRYRGSSVWRASAGRNEAPIMRQADGRIVGIRTLTN